MGIRTQYLKYGVYGFNLVFFIMGFILLGVGIWADISVEDMEELLSDKIITNAAILLMLSGSIVILLSCLGAFAVRMEKRKVLVWITLSILVVFGLELAGGLYAFTNRKEVRRQLKSGISNAVTTTYGGNTPKSRSITAAIDWIQINVECCGANDPGDWQTSSTWYKKSASEGGVRVLVPASCCRKDVAGCNLGNNIQALLDRKSIYRNGCHEPADVYMKKYYKRVGKIGMAIAFIQLVGIVLVYALSRKLKSRERRSTIRTSPPPPTQQSNKNNNNSDRSKKSSRNNDRSNSTNIDQTPLIKPSTVLKPQELVNNEFKGKLMAQSPLKSPAPPPPSAPPYTSQPPPYSASVQPPTQTYPSPPVVRQPGVTIPTPSQGMVMVVQYVPQ